MSVFSVPVTIGVDEGRIAKEIESNVESQVVEKIYDEVKTIIFRNDRYRGIDEKDHSPLVRIVEREVQKVIKDKEDIIIEEASKVLANKMYRSKACKEAMKTVIEETTK
jgi:hypothetical protein